MTVVALALVKDLSWACFCFWLWIFDYCFDLGSIIVIRSKISDIMFVLGLK